MVQVDNLEAVVNVLRTGGIILYPTDTIWGIGCDACNAAAVDHIFKLKQRDPAKKFVLLVDSVDMLKQYVAHVHPRVDTLLEYHVRPLTVVYEKAKGLPDNVVSEDGSIAIRIAQDSFCMALIAQFGRPIVATSANVSSKPFPNHFGEISSEVIQGVDYVVHHPGKEKLAGEPSVIVKLSDKGELIFLRT